MGWLSYLLALLWKKNCNHNKKKKRKKPKANDHRLTIAGRSPGERRCLPICLGRCRHPPFPGVTGVSQHRHPPAWAPGLLGGRHCSQDHSHLSPLGCSGPPVSPHGLPAVIPVIREWGGCQACSPWWGAIAGPGGAGKGSTGASGTTSTTPGWPPELTPTTP